jgi:5-methylcytosine-specific restriction endonuclease McrA
VDGAQALVGKCIHCGRKLAVDLWGRPLSDVSLEHIVPRHHGGNDALSNLAIACTRCNAQKGYRHDCARRDDPKLQRVVETLKARRAERLRPPPVGLSLPPLPDHDED